MLRPVKIWTHWMGSYLQNENHWTRLLLDVWHSLGCPGQLRALSSSSMAPFFFFSFFTRESTAFSAHFSSSSPCFQPSRRFTAGLVKEKRDVMEVEVFIMRWMNGCRDEVLYAVRGMRVPLRTGGTRAKKSGPKYGSKREGDKSV